MSNQMYADGALAAAVVAAAELAKSGGDLYYHDNTSQLPPMMIPTKQTEDDSSLGDSDEETHEQDAKRRMTKSRERNREHARKTRLRKKAQLEHLQGRVKDLQAESKVLKQSLEECSIASILVGLSSGGQDRLIVQALLKEASKSEDVEHILPATAGSKTRRKRFVPDDDVSEKQAQPLRIKIGGQTHLIGGGRTHINWKSGVYSDEKGAQKQLTQKQLESLRYVLACKRSRGHARQLEARAKLFAMQNFSLFYHSFLPPFQQTRTQPYACQDDTRPQKVFHRHH